ncbi:hypothetical protein QBC41DRAFT_107732 [Cercophora samala]|uniref:Secreted protein n=1 Tax=Cercophora samala TaxID=330535 RepID=A0AA39ZEF6_9PEZI|nr:hypothetical protein QBC41DRAFT_107732 [Cercophora samala]
MATWFAQTFLLVGLDTMIVLPLARCNPHAGWCSQEARKGTGAAKYGSIFAHRPQSDARMCSLLGGLLVGVQPEAFHASQKLHCLISLLLRTCRDPSSPLILLPVKTNHNPSMRAHLVSVHSGPRSLFWLKLWITERQLAGFRSAVDRQAWHRRRSVVVLSSST